MSGIKRYGWSTDMMEKWDDGDYVLHSDHEAEVASLRAEVEKVRKDALQIAQTLAWQCFGECRGFSDGLISTHEALAIAAKIQDAMGASA